MMMMGGGQCLSPDGKRVVTVSADKTARLWDAESGEQIGLPLVGHTDIVSSVAFSSDGRRIVTASWDKTARLWDIDSRSSIAVMRHPERVLRAAFSPDDKRVVTASSDGTARLWERFAGREKSVSAAKTVAPRCLTAAQREASFFLSAEPPAWCIEMA